MDTAEEMLKAMEQGEGLEGELAKVSSCVDTHSILKSKHRKNGN